MAERPILFSGAMVRAILAGTKTQTRRALKPQPPETTSQVSTWHHPDPRPHFYAWTDNGYGQSEIADGAWCKPCPYGEPGDRLWVRETWGYNPDFPGLPGLACYRADAGHEYDGIRWRPSIHMPRAASRITLEVTGVRVERLQSITNRDALAEGIVATHGGYGLPDGSHFHCEAPSISYLSLFESINGPGSVEADPWVWVIEFKRAA